MVQDGRMDLILVPFNSSGRAGGVALMPQALLAAGLADLLPGARVLPVELPAGDPRRGPSGLAAEDFLTAMVVSVAERVLGAWAADRVPVLIGGDCPVLLGGLVAAGRRNYDAGLVFVDGHEDAWDPQCSITGEAAVSEIALALGWAGPPPGLAPMLPCLSSGALLQLGPRDAAEPAEAGRPSIAGRVQLLAADALAAPGGIEQARLQAGELLTRHRHWWLHVDLDVLSTSALPAVDYPQPGGLSWTQLEELTDRLLGLGGCGGLSVCSYNPELDGGASAGRIAGYVAGAARSLQAHAG
jgi:arginase